MVFDSGSSISLISGSTRFGAISVSTADGVGCDLKLVISGIERVELGATFTFWECQNFCV
jgi:hypothetical protein